jgi:glycerol-3-phosphate O-acyltransferase
MQAETRTQTPSVPPYRPNPLLAWLTARFFRHMKVDERWATAVEAAAHMGTVVYVVRSLSVLDFLCIDYLTKRFGLPLIRFANDMGLWILEPFGRGVRRLMLQRTEPEEKALVSALDEGSSAMLFLRRPPSFGRTSRKGQRTETDLVRTLIAAQRKRTTPILLVPQTIIWGKLAANQAPQLWDFLLGPVEWPGRLRTFFRFLLHYRNASLRTGESFDLKAFLDSHPELDDAAAADKVRYALLRRMERERTLVVGPAQKTPQRIREEVMRSPRLRRHIEATARATGRNEAQVRREIDKELRKLCAVPDPTVIGIMHRLLDRVWHKIYDGVVVDQEGLSRVRDAARSGPLILMPSHKSHIDYLVLSDVFYTHQIKPPLIAAGDNLGFWPLGPIFRRGGAFFIRRSFKGKKLYSALVDTYMRKLLLDGHHLELFIEGGRSRTGKLLPPKFGLLSMLVDACLALPNRKVHYVPISIGYELIVEQQSYVDELSGAEKQKENIGGLLKTPEVLRSRYGRLYIQFGEILPFDQLVEEALTASGSKHSANHELTPGDRRNIIQRIGHRAVYEINRVTVVTPVALVSTCFMAHRRRGLSRAQLEQVANTLRNVLRRMGARLAPTIDGDGPVSRAALNEAIDLLRDGRLISQHGDGDEAIYTVPEERRLAVEYYKNNILHFFVPSALISAALRVERGEPVSEHALRERVRKLSRLFKYDFMYRADRDFDQIFDDALKSMLQANEVERLVDRIKPGEGANAERLATYAVMIQPYFEAYLLAAKGMLDVPSEGRERRDWIKRTLALGQRLYLAGELEDREAISKPKLENALTALKDHGLLKLSAKGHVEVGDEANAVGDFIDQLKKYLA